ncbi:MAG: sigma-54-dependent Fis family transcriptional regulator [Acidobacteria bacterium]|nr:sigma-54-dependent Fis family transcriptional regulator [Acidobacteriota bacterium]
MQSTVLIVEDDLGLQSSLAKSIGRKGHEVVCTSAVSEANRLLRGRKIDLILLDLRLPDGSGFNILRAARDLDEDIVVIAMTAFAEVKTAVRAMKEGAYDFIVKPFELDDLHLTVERAIQTQQLQRQVRRLEHERQSREGVTEILGESSAIEQVRAQIHKVAPAASPVLVVGETGTGKELVADAIHRLSPRGAGPLVKVNCSAFSEQLLGSELFGHEKGAFTDAREARAGLFEMANGGTLLLDEISEMKPSLQAELLRVVEGQPFRRVGGQREIRTNVRVIASTNRDLPARIRSGDFREDLYFRLKVFQLDVPPLRARGSDVVLLARFFLQRSAFRLRRGAMHLAPQAEGILLGYDWSGNVRELRNVMERAAIICETGEVGVEHLPGELQASVFVRRHGSSGPGAIPSLSEIEHRYIAHVVKTVGGNLSEAARVLGIARNTLKAKLGDPPTD